MCPLHDSLPETSFHIREDEKAIKLAPYWHDYIRRFQSSCSKTFSVSVSIYVLVKCMGTESGFCPDVNLSPDV